MGVKEFEKLYAAEIAEELENNPEEIEEEIVLEIPRYDSNKLMVDFVRQKKINIVSKKCVEEYKWWNLHRRAFLEDALNKLSTLSDKQLNKLCSFGEGESVLEAIYSDFERR